MNARRARQRNRDLRRQLREIRKHPPRFLGSKFGLDWFARGSQMFGVPMLPDDAPTAIKNAISVRREANLTGRCACGARREYPEHDDGRWTVVVMLHEPACIASDGAIADLARKLGYRFDQPA